MNLFERRGYTPYTLVPPHFAWVYRAHVANISGDFALTCKTPWTYKLPHSPPPSVSTILKSWCECALPTFLHAPKISARVQTYARLLTHPRTQGRRDSIVWFNICAKPSEYMPKRVFDGYAKLLHASFGGVDIKRKLALASLSSSSSSFSTVALPNGRSLATRGAVLIYRRNSRTLDVTTPRAWYARHCVCLRYVWPNVRAPLLHLRWILRETAIIAMCACVWFAAWALIICVRRTHSVSFHHRNRSAGWSQGGSDSGTRSKV